MSRAHPLRRPAASAAVFLAAAVATVASLPSPAAGATFVKAWGSKGSGHGQFDKPWGVAVDARGDVYVADTYNNRIEKFTGDGKFLQSFGNRGSGHGQFFYPDGVAVDAHGHVYVADSGNNRIEKFTSGGTFLNVWGAQGTGGGQFSSPRGVAVDGNGRVYVADTYNRRIQEFTAAGDFVKVLAAPGHAPGEVSYPDSVAVDASGHVYVADTDNRRIEKFSPTGHLVKLWDIGRHVQSVAVAGGHVYALVLTTFRDRIDKFTNDGGFLHSWGSSGTGPGQFDLPRGIAVDNSGHVYVTDTGNSRIEKFSQP